MNTPKAILIGFALVAATVYFSRDVGPAWAASGSPNFSIVDASTGRSQAAWVLNNITGKVSHCYLDKEAGMRDRTYCSTWVEHNR